MISYSRQDWHRSLVAIRGTFLHGVPLRVLFFGLIGTGAYLLNQHWSKMHLAIGLHEVAGAIIALLLAFRSNTGYQRFWEARTLWGGVVNECRNLDRLMRRHARKAPPEFTTWIVLFAHGMRRHLRGEPIEPEATALLSKEDAPALIAAPHPALYAADVLSLMLRDADLDPMMRQLGETHLSRLVDFLGGCERIRKTPTPLSYVLLAQRFIFLTLATLPFALLDELGAFTPVFVMMVAYPVLMIDALASELDEPFGHDPNDLPLTRICQTIQDNLLPASVPVMPPGRRSRWGGTFQSVED